MDINSVPKEISKKSSRVNFMRKVSAKMPSQNNNSSYFLQMRNKVKKLSSFNNDLKDVVNVREFRSVRKSSKDQLNTFSRAIELGQQLNVTQLENPNETNRESPWVRKLQTPDDLAGFSGDTLKALQQTQVDQSVKMDSVETFNKKIY